MVTDGMLLIAALLDEAELELNNFSYYLKGWLVHTAPFLLIQTPHHISNFYFIITSASSISLH